MNDCGPKKFPLWVRKIITKFVGLNKFCILHDLEYTIISKNQADANFLSNLKKGGLNKLQLWIIKYFINKYGKNYFEGKLDKNVKNSVFADFFIFTKKDGLIHPIGGKVENSESALDAFKREFFEEAGYKLKDSDFELSFTNLLSDESLDDDWYQTFFKVNNVSLAQLEPRNEVSELFEIDKYQFLNMDDEDLSHAAKALKGFHLKSNINLVYPESR